MKIKTDNYTSNGLKIKKIGGLQGIKIIFNDPNQITIKFKYDKLEYVVLWLKCNSDEFGLIYDNITTTGDLLTLKVTCLKKNCQIDLKLNDYYEIIKNQTIYKTSPWLPNEWYLLQESKRSEETDEEL